MNATTIQAAFKEQVEGYESLRVAHARLQRELDAERKLRVLDAAALSKAESTSAASAELIASLRSTITQHVTTGALRGACVDSQLTLGEREAAAAAAEAAARRQAALEQRLELCEAECEAMRQGASEFVAARTRIAELEAEVDRSRTRANAAECVASDPRTYPQTAHTLRPCTEHAVVRARLAPHLAATRPRNKSRSSPST